MNVLANQEVQDMPVNYTQNVKITNRIHSASMFGYCTEKELRHHINTLKKAQSRPDQKQALIELTDKLTTIALHLEERNEKNSTLYEKLDPLLSITQDEFLKRRKKHADAIEDLINELVNARLVFSTEEQYMKHLWRTLADSVSVYPRPEQYIERIVDQCAPNTDNSSLRVRILRQFLQTLPEFAKKYQIKRGNKATKQYATAKLLSIGSAADESVFSSFDEQKNHVHTLIANRKKLFTNKKDTSLLHLAYLLETMDESMLSGTDYKYLREHGWEIDGFAALTASLSKTLHSAEMLRDGLITYWHTYGYDLIRRLECVPEAETSQVLVQCLAFLQYMPIEKTHLTGLCKHCRTENNQLSIGKKTDLLEHLNTCMLNPQDEQNLGLLFEGLRELLLKIPEEDRQRIPAKSSKSLQKTVQFVQKLPACPVGMEALNRVCHTCLSDEKALSKYLESMEETAEQAIDLLDNAFKKRTETITDSWKKFKHTHIFLNCADTLASGVINSEDTLASLFLFAFAFDLHFDLHDTSPRNIKTLLTDYYSDNLLRYLINEEDNTEWENSPKHLRNINYAAAKEPTLGFNPKNYAQVIYVYYLNQAGSADTRLQKATDMLLKMDTFAKSPASKPVQKLNSIDCRNALNPEFFQQSETSLRQYLEENYNFARNNQHSLAVEASSQSLEKSTLEAKVLLEKALREYSGRDYTLDVFLAESTKNPIEANNEIIGWKTYFFSSDYIINTYLDNKNISAPFRTVMDQLLIRLNPKRLREDSASRTKILCLTFWALLFQNIRKRCYNEWDIDEALNVDDLSGSFDEFVSSQKVWSMFSSQVNVFLENANLPLMVDDSKVLIDQLLTTVLFCTINGIDTDVSEKGV